MKNTNEIIHDWIKENVKEDWKCVDMTTGNGHDTLCLAQHAHHVTAFDIQEVAIQQAQELTKDYKNITYIHDSHTEVNQYVDDFIHLAIFNLGYLPNGDKKIKTNKDTTLVALSKIYPKIRRNGYLIITCYRGHPGGPEEHETVLRWIKHYKNFEVQVLDYGNKKAPIAYICKKISLDSR